MRAISDDARRAAALTELAPALDPRRCEESLRKALAIRRRISEAGALVDLFPRLPDALLPEALEAVRALTDEQLRTVAPTRLAPRLQGPVLKTAVQVAQTLSSAGSRRSFKRSYPATRAGGPRITLASRLGSGPCDR